jgi:hypothetical protein
MPDKDSDESWYPIEGMVKRTGKQLDNRAKK